MTLINHVTVHLHSTALHHPDLEKLLAGLDLVEIPADPEIEAGWDVRWFAGTGETLVHLVADDGWERQPEPGLSHFCVCDLPFSAYEEMAASRYVEHHREGSGRYWINYHGLRIEVRP